MILSSESSWETPQIWSTYIKKDEGVSSMHKRIPRKVKEHHRVLQHPEQHIRIFMQVKRRENKKRC
mgnify:CR=1 FL=1